jgi:hypothetical protein
MKEVIMKKIIRLLVLICSVAVIIVSCAKKSDTSSTSTATTASGTGTGTGTTASGTVTGIDNLTGIFNTSYFGQEPSGGCIDNSSAITTYLALTAVPSDTLAFKKQMIFTSSTTFTESLQYYSDASCATLTGYFNLLYADVLVGDSLSGLSAGSNPAKPTTAKKVSYTHPSMNLKSNTDTTTAFFNSTLGSSNLATLGFTQGTELVIPITTPESNVNIWETSAMSGSSKTYLFTGSSAGSTYPTGWTGASVWWQE